MEDMIRMIAEAPDDQRRKMIGDRFSMIASEPEEKRVQSVKEMLLGISKLSPDKKKALINTRTNVLAEATPEVRHAIQVARVKAGNQVPQEVNQSDMMVVLEVCQGWPAAKHQMFLQNLGGVFKELGMQMPNMQGMMQKVHEVNEELKKPWWKFW